MDTHGGDHKNLATLGREGSDLGTPLKGASFGRPFLGLPPQSFGIIPPFLNPMTPNFWETLAQKKSANPL